MVEAPQFDGVHGSIIPASEVRGSYLPAVFEESAYLRPNGSTEFGTAKAKFVLKQDPEGGSPTGIEAFLTYEYDDPWYQHGADRSVLVFRDDGLDLVVATPNVPDGVHWFTINNEGYAVSLSDSRKSLVPEYIELAARYLPQPA